MSELVLPIIPSLDELQSTRFGKILSSGQRASGYVYFVHDAGMNVYELESYRDLVVKVGWTSFEAWKVHQKLLNLKF